MEGVPVLSACASLSSFVYGVLTAFQCFHTIHRPLQEVFVRVLIDFLCAPLVVAHSGLPPCSVLAAHLPMLIQAVLFLVVVLWLGVLCTSFHLPRFRLGIS